MGLFTMWLRSGTAFPHKMRAGEQFDGDSVRISAADRLTPQFFRFLAVGVLNTLFGQGVYAALFLAGLHPQISLLLATISGILFNFQSIGWLVFRDKGCLLPFVACYGVTYAVNALALGLLIRVGLSPIVAQSCLILPVAVLTFVLSRKYVFGAGDRGTRSDHAARE